MSIAVPVAGFGTQLQLPSTTVSQQIHYGQRHVVSLSTDLEKNSETLFPNHTPDTREWR